MKPQKSQTQINNFKDYFVKFHKMVMNFHSSRQWKMNNVMLILCQLSMANFQKEKDYDA